jgi:4a-hydroxytetrahydrobiopterin dehydratase
MLGGRLRSMTQRISARQFQEATGVEDWRVVLGDRACSYFRTQSFAKGVSLVDAIGVLADAANHHPDVDLRYGGLTVRLWTHDVDGLSQRDIELARQISAAARELGIPADPAAVQEVQVSVDAIDAAKLMPFWRAVLGYRQSGDDDLLDPRGRGPSFSFHRVGTARLERNRTHVDVSVPHDQAEARVGAAVAAGGRIVSDEHAPGWWTLADPEGNEADVATWMARD